MRVEEWGLGAHLSWLVALNETLFYVVKEIKRKKTETPLKLIYPRHTHTHTHSHIYIFMFALVLDGCVGLAGSLLATRRKLAALACA